MFVFLLAWFLGNCSFAAKSAAVGTAQGTYVNAEGSPLIPLLTNAKSSIDIEIYTMKSGTVRTLIRQALARRVRVRIVKDPSPLGDTCNVFDASAGSKNKDCLDEQKLVSDVKAAGGQYVPFNKSTLCKSQGCFQHGKIALVDSTALISTGNFDATNLCIAAENPGKCDRDFTLTTDDPTVFRSLKDIFEADLRGTSYDPASLIPSSLKDFLVVSPNSEQPLVKFISSARQSILLEEQYLKEPAMNAALISAANRGVKVSVTTASGCSFAKPSAAEIAEVTNVYTAFDKAGISSVMFNASNKINGKPGYMHAKVIIVDEKEAWLGSQNGSTESLTVNREFGYIFGFGVQKLVDTLKADHNNASGETWQQSLQCVKDKGGA